MNNEEKIIAMLENLTGTVDTLTGRVDTLTGTVDTLTSRVDTLTGTVEKHGEILSDLQKTITRVAVTQENVVIPQIKLLAEGHDTLLNTLARKDRVEALEDDMALLKTVIKTMSQRIENLEKAQ